jgi:uncharacterized membrane-anchored protein
LIILLVDGWAYQRLWNVGYGFLVVIIACAFLTWKTLRLDGILAFWVAYILTRPLGASLGDYLSQPQINGGLGLGTTIASVIFLAASEKQHLPVRLVSLLKQINKIIRRKEPA